MLILLPWYLNKLHLEVVNSILHLFKVLLYSLILAFIAAINLASYYLGITINNHIFSSCHLGEIQPYYQSFVLYLVTHSAISQTASGLLITFRKVLSIRMITVCAWKYGLSFRATVTNTKVSFSIRGYLSFAPRNA